MTTADPNLHFRSYHDALRSNFTGLAEGIARDYLTMFGQEINEAYARRLREGTAYNSPKFIPNCSPRGAYPL